jgi:hypothetical protein
MKIEYVNLEDKVFQLTYIGERILDDYVYETREVNESVPIYGKKHWWSSRTTTIRFEEKSIEKTGWYLKSWKKDAMKRPLEETDEGILNHLTHNFLSGVNYKIGEHFYIDKDKVIHSRPSIKLMLLGTDGNKGTRTLTYVYSYETEEEAMDAITRIKGANPGLVLTYQKED